jgi:hypothetical protein
LDRIASVHLLLNINVHGVSQLTDLPATEQVKNDMVTAAAKLVEQAVMSAGPTPASSAATGATTVRTTPQSYPATSARMDKVSSTMTY